MTIPELLLPAGDPEKLRYAIAYGADAVYLGLPMASLRTPSRGQQFTPQNLETHIRYTQSKGVKAYVTANIFANNRDLDRLIPHFEQLEAIRPDAIILSDPGVFRLARKHAPHVPVHLSTQANTLNVDACAFWQDLGVERVILAREVPVREMAEIHAALPDLQLECFVHGSLCVAYSGRCMISDYLTDNTHNSNKGMCGNACRWEYEANNNPSLLRGEGAMLGDTGALAGRERVNDFASPPQVSGLDFGLEESVAGTDTPHPTCGHPLPQGEREYLSLEMREATRPNEVYTFEEDQHGSYMLNSKDLCLVGHLKRLQDAGIVSFKVEGRTKSVYYVATAGRIYREAIAHYQHHDTASPEQIARWTHELAQAGNRGFTEGFLEGRPNSGAYTYQNSKTQQGSSFVGSVKTDIDASSIPEGYGAITARNPIDLTQPLEWTAPSGVYTSSANIPVLDVHGLPWTQTAIQTNQVALLPVPLALPHAEQNWGLLRQRLSNKESNSVLNQLSFSSTT